MFDVANVKFAKTGECLLVFLLDRCPASFSISEQENGALGKLTEAYQG